MAIKITLDNKGRRGKSVTVITNIPHNPQVIEKMAKELKQHCGAGGTWYQKTIEVQGDHVQKIRDYLTKKGFEIK